MPTKNKELRIFHGPVNITGQATNLSGWQKTKGFISDTITFNSNIYDPPGDFCLCLNEYPTFTKNIIRFIFFLICIFKYNIFHFYSGLSLLPFSLDLPILRIFKKKIIMTYCGSDIRLIEVEKKRNKYWELINFGINKPKYDLHKKIKMRWHNLFVQKVIAPRNSYAHANTIFPQKKIIRDIWLHNSIAIDSDYCPHYTSSKIPVLVHAPSKNDIKGTKYVDRAIQELKSEGYNFEYLKVHDIPFSEAHRIYREQADIIVDQFLLGGIGTLAFEGMYYGKPVVSYILQSVKDELFPDCPVVNANIDNLKQKLAWLLKSPEERVRLGKLGRAYVEKHVDIETINEKVWNLYHSI